MDMKFTCTKENLHKALQMTATVANRTSNLPILSNILLEATESGVTLSSTNLEIAVQVQLRAKVEQVGSFTVPAKTFGEYVNLLRSEQVEILVEGEQLVVKGGQASTKITGQSAEEYPVIPDATRDIEFTAKAGELKQQFSQVVFAAAKNEIRPELAGVSLRLSGAEEKKLALAATDSYRLAEQIMPLSTNLQEFECIVPAKTLAECIRLFGFLTSSTEQIIIALGDGQFSLIAKDLTIISRLIDGTYPDYTQIIPTHFEAEVEIPKHVFQNAIKAASLFSTTGGTAVFMTLDTENKQLLISSTNTQTGEHSERIDVSITGELEGRMALNYRYILEGLSHMSDDSVLLKMNGPDTPLVISAKGDGGYTYMVMPVRQ